MSLPEPYYSHAGITIYLGDCRLILPEIPAGSVDLVLTDPPYGVGYAAWDIMPDFAWLVEANRLAPSVIATPGIKNLFLWPPPFWIGSYSFPKGDKRSMGGGINSWEPLLIYGKNTLPIDHKQFHPVASEAVMDHPCPKPLAPWRWIIRTASDVDSLILDPFMGSGTTLVAAKQLGRRAIGIEIEEKYCEIAVRRLSQEILPLEPETRKPEQARLPD